MLSLLKKKFLPLMSLNILNNLKKKNILNIFKKKKNKNKKLYVQNFYKFNNYIPNIQLKEKKKN